jgi:hypothetical protein
MICIFVMFLNYSSSFVREGNVALYGMYRTNVVNPFRQSLRPKLIILALGFHTQHMLATALLAFNLDKLCLGYALHTIVQSTSSTTPLNHSQDVLGHSSSTSLTVMTMIIP